MLDLFLRVAHQDEGRPWALQVGGGLLVLVVVALLWQAVVVELLLGA